VYPNAREASGSRVLANLCARLALQSTDSERKRLTEQALAEAAAGRVKPVIGSAFQLTQAAAAHSAIEGGVVFARRCSSSDQPIPRQREREIILGVTTCRLGIRWGGVEARRA